MTMETNRLLGDPENDLNETSPLRCTCENGGDSDSRIHAFVNRSGTPVAVTSQYGTINSNPCPYCSSVGSGHVIEGPASATYHAMMASVTSAGPIETKTYCRRWYIVAVFSILALMQGGLCNVWTVIDQSAAAAFGWSDKFISLMQGWLYITFLVMMFPASWLMDKKGIRIGVLLSAVAVVIGTALRCITVERPYVSWLASVAQVFNGMASPVMYTVGPVISALWFPLEQRATATAISTVAGFAGNAACFLVGPNMIPAPQYDMKGENFTNLPEIKKAILHCRYVECAVCILLLLAIIVYFPNKPPKPPTMSAHMKDLSAVEKISFTDSFIDLFRKENANFWLMGVPYGLSISIYSVWTSLFDVNLKQLPNFTESEAGWLGFWGVAAGCVAAVGVGRLADMVAGHMKPILLCMNAGCILATFSFLLVAQGYVPYSKVLLLTSAVVQGIFCNGAIPLFYELSIETTYPVAEVATSAVLNILYNVLPLFFLLLFLIPDLGTKWMNWVMFGALVLSFPMMLCFKEQYKRLQLDKAHTRTRRDGDNNSDTSIRT